VVDLAIAVDFGLEPVGQGVDALRADAVETTGEFVGALAELAAGVEVRQDELDGGHVEFRMHVHRDAAPVVLDRDGAVGVDRDDDLLQ
jgi:hypothetical protein